MGEICHYLVYGIYVLAAIASFRLDPDLVKMYEETVEEMSEGEGTACKT